MAKMKAGMPTDVIDHVIQLPGGRASVMHVFSNPGMMAGIKRP